MQDPGLETVPVVHVRNGLEGLQSRASRERLWQEQPIRVGADMGQVLVRLRSR